MNLKLSLSLRGLLFSTITLALILTGIPRVATSQSQDPPKKPIKASRHNPKIETRLEIMSSAAYSKGSTATNQHASLNGIDVNPSTEVKVIIEKKPGGVITEPEIREFDGEILRETSELTEVRVPVGRIKPLAKEVEGIDYLRRPSRPVPYSEVEYGTFFSPGVNLTGGGLFHSKNLLGRGVKIAVIDVGFGSFNYAKEANEFPNGTVAGKEDYTGKGFSSGGSHGTAVAEIVHDMAPLSELYLKRIDTEVSLEEATEDAISQDVDVIVHSVGWINTNFGDGTGVVAAVAKRAIEEDILWVNAAGNMARKHWQGKPDDRDNDGWAEFSGESETISIDVNYSSPIQLFLTWNDWPKSGKDLDLFLYDGDGNLLAASQNYQTGNEPPTESLNYTPNAGNDNYKLKVSIPEDPGDLELEIFSFNHQLDPFVARSSIMAPGNVDEVFTVGGISRNNWQEGEIAPYSSRGPTSVGRTKPDLTAIDNVTTYVYENFQGTSAAAPHVAGAAALILSREPDFSSEEITQALKGDARDLGKAGPDNVYGWGKMRLLYETTSASRTFHTDRDEIELGDKLTVAIEAQIPLTLQGGIKLSEKVPEPFEVLKINVPDSADISNQKIIAEWPVVEPGTTKKLKYSVLVPENTNPGKYEFTGSVNGKPIGGSSKFTVLEATAPSSDRIEELNFEGVETTMADTNNELGFRAAGENIQEIKVKVYSLSGEEIFDSNWNSGRAFQWGLHDSRGDTVPNGIYIYFVQVRGPGGEIEKGKLRKYLVVR